MALNPEQVFEKAELPRGLTEKTIAELRDDMDTKLTGHPPFVAAPRDHHDRAEILGAGGLLRRSRSSAWRLACQSPVTERWAAS